MLDTNLRPFKDRIFIPVCRLIPRAITPLHLTFTALTLGLTSCILAASNHATGSVAFWCLNRVFDCLDGGLARLRNQSSDLGGFLDLLGDFIVYSLIPISAGSSTAARDGELWHLWMAISCVEMSFHVNNFVLFYVAAVLEKRKAEEIRDDWKGKAGQKHKVKELTSVMMRPALIEGVESGFIFTVMLARPAWTEVLCWMMTVLVGIGTCQRVIWISSAMR